MTGIGGSVNYHPVMAFDRSGTLYVAGRQGSEGVLRALDLSGPEPKTLWSSVLGSGTINQPFRGMAASPDGELYTVVAEGETERLARMDPEAGVLLPVSSSPIYSAPAQDLTFIGDVLVGAIQDRSGSSELIRISTETGRGTLARRLPFAVFSVVGFPRGP